MNSDKIIAYKGFNKDLTCRNFQYEVGKEYKHKGPVHACRAGFHACENPLDCFAYYVPGQSVYHAVELSGKTDRDSDDSKIAASKIHIGAQLDIAGICKAASDFVKSKCTNECNAKPGKPATAGNYGAATSRGCSTSGVNGLSVARGNNVKVRGGMGAILVLAIENENNSNISEWSASVVDGVKIKPDTWYTLKNGEFVEVK